MKTVGWRKVLMFAFANVNFSFMVWFMDLKDSGSILALGVSMSAMLSAAIYGNIMKHRLANGTQKP